VDEVGTRLRRAPGQANVSAVMKAVLGVAALAAAAALAVAASASSGHAKAAQLRGAVKVVFSGQGRQVLHDYKEWILQSDNECYYDKTIDESSTFQWSASFAAAPLRSLAATSKSRGAAQTTATGDVSGQEIRGDCGSDDVPPGWVQTIACSQPLQFATPSLRIARRKSGKTVLELVAPPQSLQTPSPCALVPRSAIGAAVKVDLGALAKLKSGKSLTMPVGTRVPNEVSCSEHPAPYEGTEISDSCRDTLTWSGTVTFTKS
jgi:hypothetical protein